MDENEIMGTQTALAKHLGISQPRVYQLLKKGLPRNPDGTFNLQEVRNWMLSRVSERAETLLPSILKDSDSPLVREKIEELNRFKEIMEKFKRERGDIFAGIEGKLASILEALLGSTDVKQIELIPLERRLKLAKEITTAISNLYEKERLERGESTENVAVIVAAIKKLKDQEE